MAKLKVKEPIKGVELQFAPLVGVQFEKTEVELVDADYYRPKRSESDEPKRCMVFQTPKGEKIYLTMGSFGAQMKDKSFVKVAGTTFSIPDIKQLPDTYYAEGVQSGTNYNVHISLD